MGLIRGRKQPPPKRIVLPVYADPVHRFNKLSILFGATIGGLFAHKVISEYNEYQEDHQYETPQSYYSL